MRPLLFLFPALALGCVPVHLPEPSDAMVSLAQQRDPAATLDSLTSGRQITLDECTSCHGPPKPAETTKPKWPATFTKMVGKAKLDPDQAKLVEAYLQASAALPPEPK